MDADVFDATIAAFRARVPWRPFTIVPVNGNRREIDFAGAIVVRDGVAVYAAPGGVPHIFDHEGVAEIVGDLANTREAGR